jgi:hypothetical protein
MKMHLMIETLDWDKKKYKICSKRSRHLTHKLTWPLPYLEMGLCLKILRILGKHLMHTPLDKKIKNDRTRLHVVCGFVVRACKGEHMCESVYEMRSLTTKFLSKKFIDELRYN